MDSTLLHLGLPIPNSVKGVKDELFEESQDLFFEFRLETLGLIEPSRLLRSDLGVILLHGQQELWVHIINIEIVLEELEFVACNEWMFLDHLVKYFSGLLIQDIGNMVQKGAQYGPPDAHEL